MKRKLLKDQRGFEPTMIIIIVVVVLVLGGGAFYFFNKQKDTNSNSSAVNNPASKEIQDACNKAYDDKDLCTFMANWSFGGEMKMTSTIPGENSTFTLETDSNGNTRMTSSENGKEAYAAITIGNATYMKNIEQNNWMKYELQESEDPSDGVTPLGSDIDFEEEFIEKDTGKVTKHDKEACGNLNCFKYTMTDTAQPDEEVTIWFDDKDYKLRRMSTVSSGERSEMTVEYEVAEITVPSPVVEMPNFDENMSAEELQQLTEQFGQ